MARQVSLQEVLSAFSGLLEETSLWALLYQAHHGLKKAIEDVNNGKGLLISPESILLSSAGTVQFVPGILDPSAPELHSTDDTEKCYIFSLGMCMQAAVQNEIEMPKISKVSHQFIIRMIDEDCMKRPSLEEILQVSGDHIQSLKIQADEEIRKLVSYVLGPAFEGDLDSDDYNLDEANLEAEIQQVISGNNALQDSQASSLLSFESSGARSYSTSDRKIGSQEDHNMYSSLPMVYSSQDKYGDQFATDKTNPTVAAGPSSSYGPHFYTPSRRRMEIKQVLQPQVTFCRSSSDGQKDLGGVITTTNANYPPVTAIEFASGSSDQSLNCEEESELQGLASCNNLPMEESTDVAEELDFPSSCPPKVFKLSNSPTPSRDESCGPAEEQSSPAPSRDESCGPAEEQSSPAPSRDESCGPAEEQSSPAPSRDESCGPAEEQSSPAPSRDESCGPAEEQSSPAPSRDESCGPTEEQSSPAPSRDESCGPAEEQSSPAPSRDESCGPTEEQSSPTPSRDESYGPTEEQSSPAPSRDESCGPSSFQSSSVSKVQFGVKSQCDDFQSVPLQSRSDIDLDSSSRRLHNDSISLKKLSKVFGPEFCTMSGLQVEKIPTVRQSIPTDRRYIEVVLLDGQTVQFVVELTSTCRELFTQVVAHQSLDETHIFGLAVVKGYGEVFMELDHKLMKYAPQKSSKKVLPHSNLVVFFRVKYYVENVNHLRFDQTRHLYYLQLRKDILEAKTYCHEQSALKLAAYSLQAEKGDKIIGKDNISVDDLLPVKVIRKLGEQVIQSILIAMHSELEGMTRETAELHYLREAQTLPEYGMVFYEVAKTKYEEIGSVWLGLSVRGIVVYNIHKGTKTPDSHWPWKKIQNMSFKNKQFLVEVEGRKTLHFYTDSYKKAQYLLHLCINYHRFQLLPRGLPEFSSAPSTEQTNPAASRGNGEKDVQEKLPEGETISVELTKGNGVLGLRLAGGRNKIMGKGFVYVKSLSEDSIAANCGKINEKDILLKVNGKSVYGLTHREAAELILHSESPILIYIHRPSQMQWWNVSDETSHIKKSVTRDESWSDLGTVINPSGDTHSIMCSISEENIN